MGVIDDFNSISNKETIVYAAEKMIKAKYDITYDKDKIYNMLNSIISSICSDAILIKNVVKIIELNTIALAKINEQVSSSILNSNTEEKPIFENEAHIEEVIETSIKYNTDELLSKVLLLEEKRNASSSISSMQFNTNTNQQRIQPSQPSQVNYDIGNANTFMIIEKLSEIINSKNNINKKTLIINSYNRDWINNHNRNKLSFSINIDLQNNYIEPCKILLSKNIKNKNPYITMLIGDGTQNQKFNLILGNTTSNDREWDTWVMMNENTQNIISSNIKNCNISFLDYLNKELDMGRDDIKICEVSGDNKNFKIKIDNNDDILYNSYNIDLLNKYDNMLLKTNDCDLVNVKVLNIDNNYITLNNDTLKKTDFINSSLLNYKAQYCVILSYYPKNKSL